MTLEVVHRQEKLALESGVEFRRTAPISGAGFWSVCQGHKTLTTVSGWLCYCRCGAPSADNQWLLIGASL